MSYQGQTWVDEVALPQLKNTGELIIMLRVANHAGNGPKKMSGCHAAASTLAKESLMGRSTALKHIRELTRRGLLVPGDPSLVDHLPSDKRPPVYDLAGAHESGCVGGHSYVAECTVAGARFEHPQEKTRSAGAQNEHPPPDEDGAGVQNDAERVFKSSTKSSKELKGSSLSADDPPSQPDPGASAGPEAEREPAEPKNDNPTAALPGQRNDDPAGQAVSAYTVAFMDAFNLPPKPVTVQQIHQDAQDLAAAGWSVDYISQLAAQLPENGWTDLRRHAEKNPEKRRQPSVNMQPWCEQCDSPDYRWIINDGPLRKCSCHPGYRAPSPVPA